jgi:hypothetical protein
MHRYMVLMTTCEYATYLMSTINVYNMNCGSLLKSRLSVRVIVLLTLGRVSAYKLQGSPVVSWISTFLDAPACER